jgi:hypothetical protein
MKNVTITLDDDTATWARIWAARHNTSVSRLLGQLLAERMEQESGYEAAVPRENAPSVERRRRPLSGPGFPA